tara:strand:+ start:53057 stop:53272 length:216 start_codon:yes stop_codon:yes gene_type:complete
MLLKKVVKEAKVPMSCKVDESLHDDLVLYKDLYKSVYGEDVAMNVVVEELLKTVLGKDKDFQRYKKQNLKG